MASELSNKQSVRGKNGGARPGAGRPKGKATAKTLERAALKAAYEQRIAAVADRLFTAQMSIAEGSTLLFYVPKDDKGKNLPAVQVTSAEEIKQYIDGNLDSDDYYFITTKQPDNRAIDSMLDRVFGKAPQELKHTGDRDNPVVFDIMGTARADSSTDDTTSQS